MGQKQKRIVRISVGELDRSRAPHEGELRVVLKHLLVKKLEKWQEASLLTRKNNQTTI